MQLDRWRKLASEVLATKKRITKNRKTLLAELKVCRNLQRGKEIHAEAVENGNFSCTHVATALVRMYSNCRSMDDARQVFASIEHPDVVAWNSLILGYADNGDGAAGLNLFAHMRSQGCLPDSITYVAALKACTLLALEHLPNGKAQCRAMGKQIHSEIGSHSNIFVENSLINMYAKCGSMAEARHVFECMKQPDVVSWTALILGYAENGEGVTALDLFIRMKFQGCMPNSITFIAALKASTSLYLDQDEIGKAECKERGKEIHSQIGSHLDIHVQNSLIDMYAKTGSMADARCVFEHIKHPDVVSWTALILGYAENGEGITALHLFVRMKSQGCAPDSVTFVAALKACISLATEQDERGKAECRKQGKQIHLEIGESHLSNYVQSTLIDMYGKCGRMVDACQVFEGMKRPDVVSWNALILGYTENGEAKNALHLFVRMITQGYAPVSVTFLAVFKACVSLKDLQSGRRIHAEIPTGTEFNPTLVTCLVDFYAKCGSLVEAQKVFDSHPKTRDFRTWTALLAGYSFFGNTKAAFGLFEGMQDAGFQPDGVTFLCILTCCSHAGLVEKANEFFESMSVYGITPNAEHYNCMLDILGRSNKLDDAIRLVRSMPYRPNVVTWMTVLGACSKWKNVDIGRLAFKSLVSLDERNAIAYVLMADIYGSRGMWEEQEMVMKTSL